MSEERKEILRMLSEGIIDVDGAERLLKAVEQGAAAQGDRPQQHQRHLRRAKITVMDTIQEALSGIGPAIHEAMEELHESRCLEEELDLDPEQGNEIPVESGTFEVPGGAAVVVRNAGRRHCRGGSLSVERADGDMASIESGEKVRVFTRDSGVTILWKGGDLRLRLPDATGSLEASTMGGEIAVSGPDIPMTLRAMGGSVDMGGVHGPFNVKSMGGSVSIILCDPLADASSVSAMGGGVSIDMAGEDPVPVDLKTTGGKITGDLGGRPESTPSGDRLRTEGPGAVLKVRTHGGGITLKRAPRG